MPRAVRGSLSTDDGVTMRLRSLSELPDSAAGEMRIRVAELCARFSELTGEILSISDRIHARLELLGLRTVAMRFCEHLSAEHGAVIDFRVTLCRTI